MRRIRGHEGEVGTSTNQRLQTRSQVVGEAVQSAGIQHGDTLVHIEGVDNDVRVSTIRLALTIARKNGAVIVDGGLRPQAPDHACCSPGLIVGPRLLLPVLVVSCGKQSVGGPTLSQKRGNPHWWLKCSS